MRVGIVQMVEMGLEVVVEVVETMEEMEERVVMDLNGVIMVREVEVVGQAMEEMVVLEVYTVEVEEEAKVQEETVPRVSSSSLTLLFKSLKTIIAGEMTPLT